MNNSFLSSFCMLLFCLAFSLCVSCHANGGLNEEEIWGVGPVVKKDQRKAVVSTEYGDISAVRVSDRMNGTYLLQFITLEPNSLFLPVFLHADMIFYVQTGSGILSWTDEEEIVRVNLRRGDVYRLQLGTVFYIQSNLEPERQKLRIHVIFANSPEDLREPLIGPYSDIRDLILGFDKKVLQAAYQVSEEVIEEILQETRPPAIVHGVPKVKRISRELEARFMRTVLGSKGFNMFDENKKKERKDKVFNILSEDPDVKNCNGWSLAVTREKLKALKGTDIGLLMVNLTRGSMMGPHWNPRATEIAVVVQGEGMIRVVCPSSTNERDCKNMRFRVEEGDVFAVPRYHPMAQMAFNNESLVFMGFSTTAKKNYPQFLAGKWSVLKTLDKEVLAASFNVTPGTIDKILAPQGDAVILACASCAEEEERTMEEEIQKEKEEEIQKEKEEEIQKEKEEAKEREEEEARKREEEKREEEEKAREREEEEEKKRQEEEEEEAKRREEEEKEEAAKKKEEEKKKAEQEEEARRREAEEARKEEEEASRREEEEARGPEEKEERQQEGNEGEREPEEPKRQEERGTKEQEPKGPTKAEAEQEVARIILKKIWKA